jgi:hypothetical protein
MSHVHEGTVSCYDRNLVTRTSGGHAFLFGAVQRGEKSRTHGLLDDLGHRSFGIRPILRCLRIILPPVSHLFNANKQFIGFVIDLIGSAVHNEEES